MFLIFIKNGMIKIHYQSQRKNWPGPDLFMMVEVLLIESNAR